MTPRRFGSPTAWFASEERNSPLLIRHAMPSRVWLGPVPYVNPLRSREAMLYINNILLQEGKKKMSRASVIFFLQDLAEKGWLNVGTRTGKGGHHEVYHKAAPFDQFLDSLSFETSDKLQSLKGE